MVPAVRYAGGRHRLSVPAAAGEVICSLAGRAGYLQIPG
jgi:hypothetical protein